MKLVRYQRDEKIYTGFLQGGQVVDLAGALLNAGVELRTARRILDLPIEVLVCDPLLLPIVRQAIGHQPPLEKARWPMDEVEFLPPVSRPGKVICVGLNYLPFDDGSEFLAPNYPVLFHKTASALTGHLQPVIAPKISKQVEYEGELAVVMGRKAKQITPEAAPEYIAGITIANDVGAGDIQARSSQWTSGKMFDTFCPIGPALVTIDDVQAPESLRITTRLNGEVVQDGASGQMIFDTWTLISYISGLTTLLPGDIILTGSPKTAVDAPDPRKLLKAGDVISVEIDQLGVLSNPVEKEV